MHLSPASYYSDFVVYPLIIAGLSVIGIVASGTDGAVRWMAICVGSIGLWTLIEYGLHRFVFHRAPYIKELHREHHEEERALLGTPVVLSVLAQMLLVFLPVMAIWDVTAATAATAGIMIGYLWYVSVHHVLHHGHFAHTNHLYTLKRRHALHHHSDEACNFGVTTGFWDRVFQTFTTAARRTSA
jgi:sterol desaturase/sphingolipid hydroxylase (fatty acid hydroxylase superfamily)